jgi:hypothetical protein
MTTETFELEGNDARTYFENDDDIVIQKGDRVIIELDHEKEVATWMIVPEGENPSNFVPMDDDHEGVVLWLYEHDYHSEAIVATRKSQVGMPTFVGGDQERKDILELDEMPDSILKTNFGYTDAGIENLRKNAKAIREGA